MMSLLLILLQDPMPQALLCAYIDQVSIRSAPHPYNVMLVK